MDKFKCKRCGAEWSATVSWGGGEVEHCIQCPKGERQTTPNGVAVHVFKPMTYTDICEAPLRITSKRQLAEKCKEHNVIAARLL